MYSTIHCSLFLATKKFLGFMYSKSSLFLFPFFSLYLILYVKNLIWVWLNVYSLWKQTCSNILCVPCKWTLDLTNVFLLIYYTTLKLCLFWGFPFLGPHTCYHTASLVPPYREWYCVISWMLKVCFYLLIFMGFWGISCYLVLF